jgi:hypothetical protein
MEPRLVLVLGLDTLKMFGPTNLLLANAGGRPLVNSGEIAGSPALAVLHPSGARIAGADWECIAALLRGRCGVV